MIAFGGLTVGGSGKSSTVRWFALRLAESGAPRLAVLLRGYGAKRPGASAEFVPDYEGLDPAPRAARYGDDALAHRAALPRCAAVVTGADRSAAADAAIRGFGAGILLLDDGWEQNGIRWDLLVAVLDPLRPVGNGHLLPAGPLRRPAESLAEASLVALVLEQGSGLPLETLSFLERYAPSLPRLLLRRRLIGASPPGEARTEAMPRGVRVGLCSGVGAPDRLERFLRLEGLTVVGHAAFPNHAAWSIPNIESAAADLARAGAELLLITGKDEARWPRGIRLGLPARVLRTGLTQVAPGPDPAALVRAARAGRPELAGPESFG